MVWIFLLWSGRIILQTSTHISYIHLRNRPWGTDPGHNTVIHDWYYCTKRIQKHVNNTIHRSNYSIHMLDFWKCLLQVLAEIPQTVCWNPPSVRAWWNSSRVSHKQALQDLSMSMSQYYNCAATVGEWVREGVLGEGNSEDVQWLRNNLPATAYITICAAYG